MFCNIPESKKTLIQPFVSPETEDVKTLIAKERKYWEKEMLDRRGVDRNLQLVTLNGERVRSKSELIIADRLKSAGIPYYYERKFTFYNEENRDTETWFPDFQMFNVRTRKKYYWEHFGIMDNPDYCASCQYKLETYSKHGIVMGNNLIVTMESSKHNLNVSYIDRLINGLLK